ncbi:MAG: FeoA domain-containing protein [Candidatus Methanomethylicia archaeon]
MKDLLIEVLELIKELKYKFSISDASRRLNQSEQAISEVLGNALNNGYIVKNSYGYLLTDKGEKAVLNHRGNHLHNSIHKLSILDLLRRRFEGKVHNWYSHISRSHGLDKDSVRDLTRDLQQMPWRIEDTVPLVDLREGDRALVAYILGGRGLTLRLAEMGLTPNVEVRIIRKGPMRGPIEILVRGTSLALGYGVAKRVFVRRV